METKLTIESCEGGWIVKEKGQPTRLFVRWESVIYFLEDRLTNKQRLSYCLRMFNKKEVVNGYRLL